MSNIITAKLNYLRIAPRKVRLVVDLVRGKTVDQAQIILNFTIKKATHPLAKLLKQAIANAKNNFQAEQSDLYISKITVDEGPTLKRWRARARGRAFEIKKRTSHITLNLNTIKEKELIKKKSVKIKNKKETIKKQKITQVKVVQNKKETFKSKIKIGKSEEKTKKIFRRKAF